MSTSDLRVLVAPDSFKESMTAAQAADAIARGIRAVFPGARIDCVPLADGGEGLLDVLAPNGAQNAQNARENDKENNSDTNSDASFHVAGVRGERLQVPAHDALGRPITAQIGWNATTRTVVVESAQANGMEQIAPADRDAMRASTRGVGELLLAALDLNPQMVLIGLGGSATTDLGMGMLQVLGAEFLDQHGNQVGLGGAALLDVARVNLSGLDQRLKGTQVVAACDVDNPLIGPQGAAAVFAPQKGASPSDVHTLEAGMKHVTAFIERELGRGISSVPGAGAAGGLGAAIVGPLNGQLRRGIEVVLDAVDFDAHLQGADLLITGEGAMDSQTVAGKAPWGAAQRAYLRGVPTIAFTGQLRMGAGTLLGAGSDEEDNSGQNGRKVKNDDRYFDDLFAAIVPIIPDLSDIETALANGRQNLEHSVIRSMAVLRLGGALK